VTLREVTPELAKELRLPLEHGLMVVGVDVGSVAQRVGLRLKDVVFQVGNDYVVDVDGLGMILEDVLPGQPVRIGVARGNVATWVTLRAQKPTPATGPGTQPRKTMPKPPPGKVAA